MHLDPAAGRTRVLGRGLYAQQLTRWFELFPLLFFDDVKECPQELLGEVARWLGIDAAPLLKASPEETRNAATGYRSAALYNISVRLARGLRNFPPARRLASAMQARGFYGAIKRANRSITPSPLELVEETRSTCGNMYREALRPLGQSSA